jgi:carboxyl-terminal processing protease
MSPKYLRPLYFSLVLVLGVYLGSRLSFSSSGSGISFSPSSMAKFEQLLRFIQRDYVDVVNTDSLLDNTIQEMLNKLDPHSTYINPKDMPAITENMQGNFDGIGVEFSIQNDTVVVVSAISGGPSEAQGIRAGDRIIAVEGESIAGIGLKNEEVIRTLRGERGTKVKVTIFRPQEKRSWDVTITRGKIPIYSVDAAYMIRTNIGYIRVNRFAESTFEEFQKAMTDLLSKGMQSLILDLRGNPGGYLTMATDMADDFLIDKQLIVYTEGRKREKQHFYATDKGLFENGKLVILIDEGSASASEIVAGAIQDNDRGTIIGRRSFGKGLVQEQWMLKDGSALRLTVARYYTPTGRCIQRTYANGADEYYSYGNSYHDSIMPIVEDSTEYVTPGGKIVYGGGGIMPDIEIPFEHDGRSDTYYTVVTSTMIQDFTFQYADKNRTRLMDDLGMEKWLSGSKYQDDLYSAFSAHYRKERNELLSLPANERSRITNRLAALVSRNVWGSVGYFTAMNMHDEMIDAAIKELLSEQVAE